MPARVVLPLPDVDFDVTEVAVPWHVLRSAGHEVLFATQHGGQRPSCDPRLLEGVIFGRLGAATDACDLYEELTHDPAFVSPCSWGDLGVADVDALLLAGGHAPGMRQYLGAQDLHLTVASLWSTGMPVGAICHGPVVLARAINPATGRSVLHGRRSTALPKMMERGAYLATAWRLGRYYRTYPMYVQDEVTDALGAGGVFEAGPWISRRDAVTAIGDGFVVVDGNYVSARWPGDAWTFAHAFSAVITSHSGVQLPATA
jgi:putative intracellular protease/amidase